METMQKEKVITETPGDTLDSLRDFVERLYESQKYFWNDDIKIRWMEYFQKNPKELLVYNYVITAREKAYKRLMKKTEAINKMNMERLDDVFIK